MVEAHHAEKVIVCRARVLLSAKYGRIGLGPLYSLAGDSVYKLNSGYALLILCPSQKDPTVNFIVMVLMLMG